MSFLGAVDWAFSPDKLWAAGLLAVLLTLCYIGCKLIVKLDPPKR